MPTVLGERFMADTGIEVVIEETLYNEIETKTQTGFISGTLQDLLYGHHRWLFINYLKGIYMEIDDMLASDPPQDCGLDHRRLDRFGPRGGGSRGRHLWYGYGQHERTALLQQRLALVRPARQH
jgi:hypothetical protein